MAEVEFVAIGDFHINGINNLFPNYSFEPNSMIYRSINKALVYAKENGIQHVIMLGDIFDSPYPDQGSQEQLLQFLIKHNQFNWYLPTGNHDFLNVDELSIKMSTFASRISKELDHVKFITDPELLDIEGVPFSFLPWPYCKTLQEPSVNIAHVEIKGSKSDNGKVFDKGYKLSPDGVYIIGHLHRRQEYGKVYYPGTLFQKTFGEPANKGFYHARASFKSGKIRCNCEWVPVKPPFELKNLKIIDPQDLKEVQPPDPKRIIQYRLLLRNKVELPVGFLEDHPNCIDVTGKLSVKEMDNLEKQNFSIDIINAEVELLDGLPEFLSNDGLSEKQISRAVKLVNAKIAELGVAL